MDMAKFGFGNQPLQTRNYIDQVTGRMPQGQRAGNSTTTSMNINQVTVTTQARDAAAVAQYFRGEFQSDLVSQANSGPQ